jgi:hypothetical protein
MRLATLAGDVIALENVLIVYPFLNVEASPNCAITSRRAKFTFPRFSIGPFAERALELKFMQAAIVQEPFHSYAASCALKRTSTP